MPKTIAIVLLIAAAAVALGYFMARYLWFIAFPVLILWWVFFRPKPESGPPEQRDQDK